MDAERGNGLGSGAAGRQGVSHPEHPRRNPRGRWHAGRPGLPHGALGSGAADGRGGERTEGVGRGAVRGVLHGPVRRAHAGHYGDVRFPALPQRRREHFRTPDPLAAHAPRRPGRGHVRQGTAGDDDGAGRRARSAGGADSRRRDAAARRGRGRGQGAIGGRALRPRDDHAGRRFGSHVPLLRFAGRRLPVPGHGGDGAGGGRSARHVAAAFGAGALGAPDLAGHGAALGTRGDAAGSARPGDARSADGRQRAQCDGDARRVRRVDEPDSASAGDRVFGRPRAAHGGRLDARQSTGAAPGGCAAQWSADVSHGAGLPGGRRSRSDAAPAPRRIAGDGRAHGLRFHAGRHAGLVGAIGAAGQTAPRAVGARRHRSGRCDHGPGRRAAARPDLHGDVSPRAILRPADR